MKPQRSTTVVLSLIAASFAAFFVFSEPSADERQLEGLWSRYDRFGPETAPMSFYFFKVDEEGAGFGLFRYGKVGFNNTHSYDFSVENDETLVFKYRKTGEVKRVKFRKEPQRGKHPELVLVGDPNSPGEQETRYTFIPLERAEEVAPDFFGDDSVVDEKGIGGRVWMDKVRYATGGEGFAMYHLRAAGIDGRGTGWFHAGDFDDWTTEALSYKQQRASGGMELDVDFLLRGERHTTPMAVQSAQGVRLLTLQSDPRDFWAPHRFVDAGPAFGAFQRALAAKKEE